MGPNNSRQRPDYTSSSCLKQFGGQRRVDKLKTSWLTQMLSWHRRRHLTKKNLWLQFGWKWRCPSCIRNCICCFGCSCSCRCCCCCCLWQLAAQVQGILHGQSPKFCSLRVVCRNCTAKQAILCNCCGGCCGDFTSDIFSLKFPVMAALKSGPTLSFFYLLKYLGWGKVPQRICLSHRNLMQHVEYVGSIHLSCL